MTGEKSFNYQRVLDLSPGEVILPSEMGLPIFLDSRMPVIVSFRGKMNSDPSLSSIVKFDTTFETVIDGRVITRVGTIVPFTGETIETGVDQHITMSLPVDFNLHVNIPEGKISTNVKLASKYSRSSPIDLLYVRSVPFTVHHGVFDLKPIFKSENFKVIHSRVPESREERTIGDYLGLDMKLMYKSETPFLGLRYALEKMSNFHYNPLNLARFYNVAMMGLTTSGRPSFRKHEMRIVFHPETSSTKQISFDLKFGYGTKVQSQPIKYHKIELHSSSEKLYKVESKPAGEHSSQPRRQEKIKNILEKMEIDAEGQAFTVFASTTLMGSRPRSYTYSATFGVGQSALKQKWDLKLKSEHSAEAICIVGDVEIPMFSIWKINEMRSESPVFHAHNVIGYGNECEKKIILTGYAKTSEEQKRLSHETPEAKEYNRLLQKGTPMIQLSKLAETVRRQATQIDEYKYKIEYVRVGKSVAMVSKQALELLQVYWLPYARFSSSSPMASVDESLSSESMRSESLSFESMRSEVSNSDSLRRSPFSMEGEVNYAIEAVTKVHSERKTFDVVVEVKGMSSGEPTYIYKEVPIPSPFRYMYAVSYVHDPISELVKSATGKPLYPVCTVEGKHISTFDNRTYEAKVDSCFHLLSGDCSKSLQYGVIVRSLESESGKKEIKVLLEKVEITLKPEGGSVVAKINERHVEVPKTERKQIKNSEGKIVATIIR
jgi:hypothetical protein